MSTLEVDKIIPQGSGTALQIGESGDTITLPAGTTITLPTGSISNSELANSSITIKIWPTRKTYGNVKRTSFYWR